jgi:hypothetical protein
MLGLKDITPKGRNIGDFGMYSERGNARVGNMIIALLRLPITTSPAELSKILREKIKEIASKDFDDSEVYDTVVRENILKAIATHTHRKMSDFDI